MLTNHDLLSTFIAYFTDCMSRALEVSWLYVTLITFVIINIIIIIIIKSTGYLVFLQSSFVCLWFNSTSNLPMHNAYHVTG